MDIEQYQHHGQLVYVQKELKGKHREHCLCYGCDRFKPGTMENCHRATLLYKLCVLLDMTTPVWECPIFIPKEEE